MIRATLLAALLFGFVPFSGSQPLQRRLDDFFAAMVINRQFSGNVLVADNGRVVYRKSFGYADHASKTPNTKAIRFPIASISKTLTATAILQLQERGLLDVEMPASTYLAGFPYPALRVRHLLSHTSGLPPYNAFFDSLHRTYPDQVFHNTDFLRTLVANPIPLLYEPGEKGNYDNINYIALALIIEKVSGLAYPEYIRRNILEPAGMRTTIFYPLPEQYNASGIRNFSYPHVYRHIYDAVPIRANTVDYIRQYWHSYAFAGFADYITTTNDLLAYDRALYGGKLLSGNTLAAAFRSVLLNDGSVNADRFGLGWEVEADSSFGKIVYHSGAATGLSCVMLRNVGKHQTVILFDNAHYDAHETAWKVMKILNGKRIDPPGQSLASFYGRFRGKGSGVAAIDSLKALSPMTVRARFEESELNALGYDLLDNDNPFHFPPDPHFEEALEIFRLTAKLYPDSWNAHDSYGEALLKLGRREDAIREYRRSMELNPGNENGRMILKKMGL